MTATLTAPSPTHATPPTSRNWTTPALVVLLAGTAVLYLWNLTDSGWGNSYYAAATQAGAQSWTAWLFGGLDAGGVITVDKPPAALWVSGLSARIFGFSSWTVLAPQAVEGVLAVWLLYATVKRTSGAVAGLLAGAALASTPVAVLMFRFNLPDALLTLLMVAGAYCTVRALEKASWKWLALAGVAVGFAFLTKMGQALPVLPGFAVAYLLAAPTTLGKRLLHLVGAGVAVVVSAGWFIALVELWPTASRPYIGGSRTDSLWQLAMGYNGLGRIFGGGRGGGNGVVVGDGNGNTAFGGEAGIGRLFGAGMGAEVSWLLPAAIVGVLAGLWFTRRAPRTDRTRAALLSWGLWVLVNGIVFSLMSGITHPYYTVAVAPGVAAIVAIAGREMWRGRAHLPVRVALAAMVAACGFWGFSLLVRYPEWLPALRWAVLALTVVVTTAIVMGVKRTAAIAVVTALLSSVAFGVATAGTAHGGSIPMSGPAAYTTGQGGDGGMRTSGEAEGIPEELTDLLKATTGTWAAAAISAQAAASLSLSSGKAVIGIGGWSGGDPAPTLEEFRQYVADGRIGYFVSGGQMGGPAGNGDIATWVADNHQPVKIGDRTVYKLS
ncbi:4-amino-4-deoxy-L-arabinose transferase-like glycosyltransferase [Saccharothrix tamanrassetensis]|uniref:4-amino-4-deoxy-L-arabinose transferase-like glycosyltransferase n=1 Tax=Saccharothrix tamanrassetensis TaxID=1051531 RepID=A0A841CU07_9PSEU|nr:glycosyltransferase family 39 protein [Saccharothrix tamanrassetensis]MBB5959435.1 4-amino-4-deoxy-L-arabinose transferase-like glycosyltransferase [Saccharothrix tamanrassetensis]